MKKSKKLLALCLTVAVAVTMCLGSVGTVFAASGSFNVSGDAAKASSWKVDDIIKAADEGGVTKTVTFDTLNSAGTKDQVEVKGVTFEDFFKIVEATTAVEITLTDVNDSTYTKSFDSFDWSTPDKNGNLPMIAWYKKSANKGKEENLDYLTTAFGQANDTDNNNGRWFRDIGEISIVAGINVSGNGVKAEGIYKMADIKDGLKDKAVTVKFTTLNQKGKKSEPTVTGVKYADFAKHVGATTYVYKTIFKGSDGTDMEFDVSSFKVADMNGNLPLIIWNKDGEDLPYVGTAFGQKDADDQNQGKWAKYVAAIEFKAVAKPTITVKAQKGSVKVSWKKNAENKGYQVSQSTKKTGTVIKAKAVTTSSKTIKAKKGKNLYYKVRAYVKDSNGKTVYGPWSTAKKCKAK